MQLTTNGIINRREQLLVGGRDRTSQLDALERQMTCVTETLDRHGADNVGVLGALCYPYMRRPFLYNGRARDGLMTVDDPRHVAKVANRPGPLTLDEINRLVDIVGDAFPAAG